MEETLKNNQNKDYITESQRYLIKVCDETYGFDQKKVSGFVRQKREIFNWNINFLKFPLALENK